MKSWYLAEATGVGHAYALRGDWVVLTAVAPEVSRSNRAGRHPDSRSCRRKLDACDLELVARFADDGRSLREIAAEVGVSHETVRKALSERAERGDHRSRTAGVEPTPVIAVNQF